MLNQQIFDKIFFYNVKKKEVVTLIYENSKSNIIKYFKKYDNKINYFNLDDHGKRPLKKIPDEIVECIKKTDILFFFSDKYSDKNLDEYLTIRKPLIELKNENSLLRIGMLLSTNLNLFKNIFKYDPNEVKRLNKKIIKLLNEKNTSEIIIKTSSGTDLIIETSKKYNWINQDADLKKLSEQHSLLAGEVYGYPEKINGILVVNGSMGGTFSKYDLSKNPLTLSIKNGKIIKFKSNCDNLIKELNFTFKNIKNSNRIGEIGFGTNISLKKFYNVIGIDEKYPGNHIAFGNPYGEKTNASWTSKIHVDCVIKKCNTWINGKQILKNGKYLI